MKTLNNKTDKVVKLKNRYTGDIVETVEYDQKINTGGTDFIKVYNPSNPNRTFLVNKEAYFVV